MKYLILGALFVFAALGLQAAPLTAEPNEAFILLNQASIYQDKGFGKLEWLDAGTLGDKVTVLSGVTKFKVNGYERDYYKVKLPNGKIGVIRTSLLGLGATLGVIKTDGALTYSEPRDVKITDRTLARGQIVAVLNDPNSGSFLHVVGYDEPKDLIIPDTYVSPNDISTNDVDVNAIILLTVAKAEKNTKIKTNLLNVALSKYSSSDFIDMVQAALGTKAAEKRPTQAASGQFVVNDDNVNVRDIPVETGSNVVGTLTKGQNVTIVATTVEKYTVNGQTGLWYQISSPSGWVFGPFLTAQ